MKVLFRSSALAAVLCVVSVSQAADKRLSQHDPAPAKLGPRFELSVPPASQDHVNTSEEHGNPHDLPVQNPPDTASQRPEPPQKPERPERAGSGQVQSPTQDQIGVLQDQFHEAISRFLDDQKRLRTRLRDATTQERDSLRQELRDNLQKFLEQRREAYEDARTRATEMRNELSPELNRVIDSARDQAKDNARQDAQDQATAVKETVRERIGRD